MYTEIINSFLSGVKAAAAAQNKHYMEPRLVNVEHGGIINIGFLQFRKSAEIEIETKNNRMEVILEEGFKYCSSKVYSLDENYDPVFGEIVDFMFKNKRKRKCVIAK